MSPISKGKIFMVFEYLDRPGNCLVGCERNVAVHFQMGIEDAIKMVRFYDELSLFDLPVEERAKLAIERMDA